MRRKPLKDLVTLVGAYNIEDWNGGSNHEPEATVHKVARLHWHPKGVLVGTKYANYDFALLELRDPITFWIGAKEFFKKRPLCPRKLD